MNVSKKERKACLKYLKWYVLFFYCLNFIMVGTDIILYFRNRKLDAQRDTENAK